MFVAKVIRITGKRNATFDTTMLNFVNNLIVPTMSQYRRLINAADYLSDWTPEAKLDNFSQVTSWRACFVDNKRSYTTNPQHQQTVNLSDLTQPDINIVNKRLGYHWGTLCCCHTCYQDSDVQYQDQDFEFQDQDLYRKSKTKSTTP